MFLVYVKEFPGLDCDISLQNPLALANTRLLRAYSEIDPRVRELAFLIKHWAKSRHLNSPANGTLSSYGFILLLIHFLQASDVRRMYCLLSCLDASHSAGSQSAEAASELERQSLRHALHAGGPLERQQCGAAGDRVPHQRQDPVQRLLLHATRPVIGHPQGKICSSSTAASLSQHFARENKESTAELLLEFFKYYSWKFDHRSTVVSVHTCRKVGKLEKVERDAWNLHDRLRYVLPLLSAARDECCSIEDPFETWYDVAHVVKAQQMAYLVKEFHVSLAAACAHS